VTRHGVTGIGGLFFRARDPERLRRWDPNGRFARLPDPEGDPVELWEMD
jgi:hypothetical protein